ncbi:MAG TPA: ABC transporter permease [Acidobacteriaceae bacterium]|nr:ABC transporter permease [Acidobacteriaceae bacterium]
MRAILQRIAALTKKELLALLRDAASRAVLIGPPIIQLVVFGYAATFDLKNIPFVVYNQDAGVSSRDLIARFTGSPNFHLLHAVHSQKEIAAAINTESALLAIDIGPDFTRRIERGQSAHMQLILDGRDSNTAAMASGYAQTIVRNFNQNWIAKHGGTPSSTVLMERAWFNPNLESRWFIVPGICGILTLLVSMLTTGLSVAREREMGTFDQLLVTPLRPTEILLGKALPGFIVGTLEGSLIILVAVFWFHVPFNGSILALYFGLFCFLLSTVGIGLMISSLAVTQQQGLLGVFLFMVPAIVLSGFATPIANMPIAVQYITLLDPLRYFLIILRSCFLQGAEGSLLWPQYLPLIAIGLVSMTIAGQLFRRRLN